MTAVDRFLNPYEPPSTQTAHVARTVNVTEQRVADHEIATWGLRQVLDIDLRARAEAASLAIALELDLLDEGLARAGGNPIAQELVLRYLQDTNAANRRRIRDWLG